MEQHTTVTSHHLKLISQFAAMVDLQPRVENQQRNSALSSILGHYVSRPAHFHSLAEFRVYQPSPIDRTDEPLFERVFDVAEFTGLVWNPSFTPPRYSTSSLAARYTLLVLLGDTKYLERAYPLLLELDSKVSRLKYCLTNLAEAFLTKQDQEVRRNPSRHVAKQLPYDSRFIGCYPTIGPYQVVPLCRVTSDLVVNTPQLTAWGRCPHDCLCKPGETRSLICQACRLGLPPWEQSRKPLTFTDHPLNNVDDADLIEGLTKGELIEDHKIKNKTRIAAPTKQQTEKWNTIFSDAGLRAELRDYNIAVSLTGDGGVPLDTRSYHDRHASQMFEAAQSWKRVGVVIGPTCLRCEAAITNRKGTKYCSENCRKRHWEETNNQGEN